MLLLLAGLVCAFCLPGCTGGGKPPVPASASSSSSTPGQVSTPAPAAGAQSIAELLVSFQQMQLAVMTFRNMEAANTNSTGVIRAAGYVAAANDMKKKRDAFEKLLAATNPSDVPQVVAIREGYAPVSRGLKAYITVTNVNGILGGPDARASTLNYGLFAVKALSFQKTLTNLQQPGPSGKDIVAAEKALRDASEKYFILVGDSADPTQVKAAAAEVEKAKARLSQLQGK